MILTKPTQGKHLASRLIFLPILAQSTALDMSGTQQMSRGVKIKLLPFLSKNKRLQNVDLTFYI